MTSEELLKQRVAELEEAIRQHRSQKADDRCWEDDQKLYAVLNDGNLGDNTTCDPCVMLENCKRFISNRMQGGDWPSYEELEQQIKHLNQWVADLQSGIHVTCAFCGRRYGPAETPLVSMADALREHIQQCSRHPMSELQRENDLHRRRIRILELQLRLVTENSDLRRQLIDLLRENLNRRTTSE